MTVEIILDTSIDPTYRGHIDHAVEMVKNDECDAIITHGSDFMCIRYKDPEKSKAARERSLARLSKSEIRYVVIARHGNEPSLCLGSDNEYTTDFSKAVLFRDKHAARGAMHRMKKPDLYDIAIETYLYRTSDCCRLRIYYTISGLKTDKGTLAFIREQVDNGVLLPHFDRSAKPYVLLEDLVIFNDQNITFKNASGVEYTRVFDLRLLLHDGLIAFDAVSKFVNKHPEFDVCEVKYLTANSHGTNRRVFYDLGTSIYLDGDLREIAVKELCLQDWFS